MQRLTKAFVVLVASALAGTVAMAVPTTYTRVAGDANWTDAAKWIPATGHPGTDVGDTAVFGLGTGYLVTMDANKTVDSVIVTNSGSWRWRYIGARVLTVNNVFSYSNSATSYFGDDFGAGNNTIAAIAGTGKVRVDAGTLHLMSPQNAYSGGTEINGGTVWANVNRRVNTGTYLGSGAITIGATGGGAADAALWMSANGALTFAMPITIRSGNAGSAQVGYHQVTGVSAAGQNVTFTGGITLQKDLTLADGYQARALFSDGLLTLATVGISGSGNLAMDGIGIVRSQAANSYAGTTTVRHGILTLENAGNSNTGNMLVKGGLLMANSIGNAGNTITLGDNGTFGAFGAYNTDPGFDRTITLTGNGGLLQSIYQGPYRQLGSGIITGPGRLILGVGGTVPTGVKLANNNNYSGGTDIILGVVDNVSGLADNNSLFGTGDVNVKFNGALLLRGNNVASGKKLLLTSTGSSIMGARASVRLYAGVTTVPTIDPNSSGILMLNANNNAVFNALVSTNSPQLGNGYMLIGSDGYTFTGASLQANLDNVYRLGTLNAQIVLDAAASPVGVLTGARSLEIGQRLPANNTYATVYRAGYVNTLDANDFTGSTTVYQASQFRGTPQTTAGQSPFGSTNGAVILMGGELYLDDAVGGQPVAKGELTFDGPAAVQFESGVVGHTLTFNSLNRVAKGMLLLTGSPNPLGSTYAKIYVNSGAPTPDNNMVAPYFRDTAGHFMNYTANGFTTSVYTHVNLTGVDSNSIVNTAGGNISGSGTVNVYALRTTGILTGTATDSLNIRSGGLTLASASTHTAPISFGAAEGVIFDTGVNNTLSGKLTGAAGFIKAGTGVLVLNADNSATLAGPVTINQGMLQLVNTGSLSTNSVITLNGGQLEAATIAQTVTNAIALGNLGGIMGANAVRSRFLGNITGGPGTGPLMLYAYSNARTTIAGTNSYSGGTIIGATAAVFVGVEAQSSLGTGDVTVEGGGTISASSRLILWGDSNIAATARVFLVNVGSMVEFQSANPSIGSLEGNGTVLMGVGGLDAVAQTANTRLTIGNNNQSTEFYGRIGDVSSCLVAGGLAYNQLVKVGTGNLTLWGENLYKGGTTISNGTLTVNNYINTNGWVAISPLGTLDGIGTVGPVTNNGGTIRGSVHMASLTLASSASTFDAVLNGTTPASEYSQVALQSGVNLNGSVLHLTLGYKPAVGQAFTIMTSTGTITGQFACGTSVTGTYGGKTYAFRVDYQANAIVLTRLAAGTLVLIE